VRPDRNPPYCRRASARPARSRTAAAIARRTSGGIAAGSAVVGSRSGRGAAVGAAGASVVGGGIGVGDSGSVGEGVAVERGFDFAVGVARGIGDGVSVGRPCSRAGCRGGASNASLAATSPVCNWASAIRASAKPPRMSQMTDLEVYISSLSLFVYGAGRPGRFWADWTLSKGGLLPVTVSPPK